MRKTIHFFILLSSSTLVLLHGLSSEHSYCSSIQTILPESQNHTYCLSKIGTDVLPTINNYSGDVCFTHDNAKSASKNTIDNNEVEHILFSVKKNVDRRRVRSRLATKKALVQTFSETRRKLTSNGKTVNGYALKTAPKLQRNITTDRRTSRRSAERKNVQIRYESRKQNTHMNRRVRVRNNNGRTLISRVRIIDRRSHVTRVRDNDKKTLLTRVRNIDRRTQFTRARINDRRIPVTRVQNNDRRIPVTRVRNNDRKIPLTRVQNNDRIIPVTPARNNDRRVPVTQVRNNDRRIPVTRVRNNDRRIPMTRVRNNDRRIPMTRVRNNDRIIPVTLARNNDRRTPVSRVQNDRKTRATRVRKNDRAMSVTRNAYMRSVTYYRGLPLQTAQRISLERTTRETSRQKQSRTYDRRTNERSIRDVHNSNAKRERSSQRGINRVGKTLEYQSDFRLNKRSFISENKQFRQGSNMNIFRNKEKDHIRRSSIIQSKGLRKANMVSKPRNTSVDGLRFGRRNDLSRWSLFFRQSKKSRQTNLDLYQQRRAMHRRQELDRTRYTINMKLTNSNSRRYVSISREHQKNNINHYNNNDKFTIDYVDRKLEPFFTQIDKTNNNDFLPDVKTIPSYIIAGCLGLLTRTFTNGKVHA